MNETLAREFCEQVKQEFYSSYLYLQISNESDLAGLTGFASWFRKQSAEEHAHALRFVDFLLDRDEPVPLFPIEAPPRAYGGPRGVLESALEHELFITERIRSLHEIAEGAGDRTAMAFLDAFLLEQVEEVKQVQELLDWIDTIGEASGASLAILDQRLGTRD